MWFIKYYIFTIVVMEEMSVNGIIMMQNFSETNHKKKVIYCKLMCMIHGQNVIFGSTLMFRMMKRA